MSEKLTVGELVYKISGDVKDLSVKLDKTEKELKNIQAQMVKTEKSTGGLSKSFNALKLAAAGLAIGLGYKLAKAFRDSITDASDLGESINAVNVVFGQGSNTILKFGQNAAKSVGLAASEFNQLSTVTGALLKDTGLNTEEVAQKTIELTKRASDMASVFNTDVKDALSAINQAIRGETEAIRRYAGNVTDAEINTFNLANGINKTSTEMTEQEKRLTRIDIIMKQTSVTQGDFGNTSDELANKTRILNAEIKNKSAEIGAKLLPLYSKWISALSFVVSNVETLIDVLKTLFGTVAAFVATSKFIVFFTELKIAITGTTTAIRISELATLSYIRVTNLLTASLIRLRAVLLTVQVAFGLIAAAATGAALLIQSAAKKAGQAWDDAAEAQQKAADSTLELLKVNLERRRIAEASSSEKVKALANAEFEFQKGIIQGVTEEQQKELAKRRDDARVALRESSDDVEEWADINIRAREKVNPTIEENTVNIEDNSSAINDAKAAAEKAAQELENMQQKMLDLSEASKEASDALKKDFTEALSETTRGLAEIVINAEEKIKELKKSIKDEEDADRKKQLRDELKEQEEILKAKEGFEERQAERTLAIREKLAKVGLAEEEINNLLNTQTLEEQIAEERRIASLDEFTRFEELQTKKIERIVNDIITRRELENELTAFLKSQDIERKASIEAFANAAIEKYGEMARSLRSAIALQAQLNSMRSSGSNRPQFHTGGYVDGRGGEVHPGEYVIPANLVGKYSNLVSGLENVRKNGDSSSVVNNRNVNAPITVNANVQDGLDFQAISKELAWEIGRR